MSCERLRGTATVEGRVEVFMMILPLSVKCDRAIGRRSQRLRTRTTRVRLGELPGCTAPGSRSDSWTDIACALEPRPHATLLEAGDERITSALDNFSAWAARLRREGPLPSNHFRVFACPIRSGTDGVARSFTAIGVALHPPDVARPVEHASDRRDVGARGARVVIWSGARCGPRLGSGGRSRGLKGGCGVHGACGLERNEPAPSHAPA